MSGGAGETGTVEKEVAHAKILLVQCAGEDASLHILICIHDKDEAITCLAPGEESLDEVIAEGFDGADVSGLAQPVAALLGVDHL